MIRLFGYRMHRTRQEAVPFCRKVLFVLGTLLAITAVCSSCRPEEEGMTDAEDNLPAIIRLEVQGEEQADMATRAVNESTVDNLHVLVYNSTGELIGQKYQTGSSTVTVNTRSAAGCTIYAIANTGKADLFKGYAIHKEAYLKSLVCSLTNWDELDKGTNLLMTGSMKSVNIKAGAQTLSTKLVLTRMVAKVVLNIKVKESSGITITNYSIKDIPSRSYYVARASEDAVQAATAAHWKESGVIATSGATSASRTFYMFENRRGTKAISVQKNKTTANAPAKATYVVIHGSVGTVAVTWTVYLGENNTSDFNIKRNGSYTYNITLNDAATTDTRVVVDFTGTEDLSSAGTANCYLAKKVNTWYKFKATVRGNGAATTAQISPTGSALAANAAISPTSAELVWETNGHGKIIQGVILKNGYVYFKTGPTAEGNAVIAAKDGSGNVLWSWHIWKTHFDLAEMPTQTYKTNPRIMDASFYYNGLVSRSLIMMDRNVGAETEILYNSDTKEKTLSLFYQFGRKDPFPAGKNKTGEISIYDKAGNHLDGSTLNGDNYMRKNSLISKETASIIAYAIANPLTFILYDLADVDANSIPTYNWIYGAYSPATAWKASNKLWGGDVNSVNSLALDTKFTQKTIYDPCPLGWHMPPQDVWTNFTITNTGETSPVLDYNTKIPAYYNSPDKINVTVADGGFFSTTVYGRQFFISSTSGELAFYPAVGYRYGGNGQVYNISYYCCAWSSSPYDSSSSFAHYLGAINEGVGPTSGAGRGHAFPIRCVKETP